MPFFTIAVKLQLVIPKINKKDKMQDQKNLLANFIFLKVVVIDAMLLAQTILCYK